MCFFVLASGIRPIGFGAIAVFECLVLACWPGARSKGIGEMQAVWRRSGTRPRL